MPTDEDRLQRRLEDLEVKSAFTEDLVDRLNEVVVRQQQQIDLLIREVTRLMGQLGDQESTGRSGPVDERPPHY